MIDAVSFCLQLCNNRSYSQGRSLLYRIGFLGLNAVVGRDFGLKTWLSLAYFAAHFYLAWPFSAR